MRTCREDGYVRVSSSLHQHDGMPAVVVPRPLKLDVVLQVAHLEAPLVGFETAGGREGRMSVDQRRPLAGGQAASIKGQAAGRSPSSPPSRAELGLAHRRQSISRSMVVLCRAVGRLGYRGPRREAVEVMVVALERARRSSGQRDPRLGGDDARAAHLQLILPSWGARRERERARRASS